MPGTIIHTVCMQTKDALRRAEGEVTMRLAGDNPRFNAVKLSLGSLEFPIVQWTIEEDWCRLYFSEGYRIEQGASWLRLEERTEAVSVSTTVGLPLYLNPIVEWRVLNEWMVARCAHAHNLWVQASASVIPGVEWGDVEIVCGPMGRVSLSALHRSERLLYMSETEFMIPIASVDTVEERADGGCGYVHVPTVPSPNALCQIITFVLQRVGTLAVRRIAYDASTNRASLLADDFPPEAHTLHLKLCGSPLAATLGYRSANGHERRFRRRPHDHFQLQVTRPLVFHAEYDDLPLALPCEQMGGWESVRLQLGWYAPQHRPMLTGQPLRLASEVEMALNRLYFPMPERIPAGTATGHFLIFQDPCGQMHQCPVYAGRYSPHTFGRYLESAMTAACAVSSPHTTFTVDYDPKEERFTIACEIETRPVGVVPAPFGLLFNHPAQFDPARLGFDQVPLHGSATYTSTSRVCFPHFETPRQMDDNILARWHSNIYRVSEVSHQKILRLHAAPPPAMTGMVSAYLPESCELQLRTFSGQLPFAHGLQSHTIVRLAPSRPVDLFVRGEEDEWKEVRVNSCPVAPRWGRTAVVLPPDDVDSDPMILRLRVRDTPRLSECLEQALQVQVQLAPFNFCFGTLPQSLRHTALGFPRGALQWGVDGSVPSSPSKLMLPPFDAPHVHSLDHPDYILLYLVERNKKGTALQHADGSNTTTPFAKLVLYPLFREERMLPRDTTLLSGESMSQFTLRFANPDGSPYHFHGAEFSFSLNFIASSPE